MGRRVFFISIMSQITQSGRAASPNCDGGGLKCLMAQRPTVAKQLQFMG